MKKFFVICMSLMLAGSAMAQESNRTADGKVQFGPYETNHFLDNIFVGVGGGATFGLDRVTFEGTTNYDYGWGLDAEAYVGKYFTPEYGVRLGWQGVNTYWGSKEDRTAWPGNPDAVLFNYVHGDILWNVSNQFWGYKENRLVNVVPYLHAGFLWGHEDRSLGIGAGVEVPFQITERIAVVPDVRVMGTQATFIHPETSGIAQVASASVSFRVTLGKANWVRRATTVDYYTALLGASDSSAHNWRNVADREKNRADKAESTIKALAYENSLLKAEIDKLNTSSEMTALQMLRSNPLMLYFEIGEYTLSEKEIARLRQFINETDGTNVNVTVSVAGGSDSKTGTENRNEFLREKRAEYVYNLLVNEYDFAPESVVVTEGVVDIDTPELSRVAIVSCN